MYLFILGRQPEIGLAEIDAVYGNAELIMPQVAIVKAESQPNIDRLGGTRKIGLIIYDELGEPEDFLIKKFTDLPAGKVTLAISQYGKTASRQSAQKIARFIKSHLSRSVRVLPNQSAEISDAATLGNRLGTSPNKVELLVVSIGQRTVVAELIGVQDLNSYTFRDRSRPRRDARNGMLPPKLAQIMINLARIETIHQTNSKKQLLLDPFCGTGVVLQEALLQGYDVYGTDLNPRMIDYTRENLAWLTHKYHLTTTTSPILETADATEHQWNPKADAIVCETYLGQPYTSPPNMQTLNKNIQTCNIIIKNFLTNLLDQITPDTKICLAVPAWFLYRKFIHLPVASELTRVGYKKLNTSLIYHRNDQFVARELLVLQKLK